MQNERRIALKNKQDYLDIYANINASKVAKSDWDIFLTLKEKPT